MDDLEKMEFIILFTMIGDLTRNTASISTMKKSAKIFTGTAIRDIPQWKTGEKRIIFLLARLNWLIIRSITATMCSTRTSDMRKPDTQTDAKVWKRF